MLSTKGLRTPGGICKLALIGLGIVLLGFSAGSFPNEHYREYLEDCRYVSLPYCDATSALHKEYMFFTMTIISMVWALVTFAITLAWPKFKLIDTAVHVLVGILLLIGSILVLQSVNYRYGLGKDCSSTDGPIVPIQSSHLGGWCRRKYENDFCASLQCYLRNILKYDLTMAAGILGLGQSVLFFVTAVSVFNTKDTGICRK